MLLLISFSILLVLYGVLLIALLLDNKVRLELGGGSQTRIYTGLSAASGSGDAQLVPHRTPSPLALKCLAPPNI